ncbi:MAG: CPBP family intramembrane glutamic endopeptidase [Halanaerobiales bacterium]
MVHFKTIMMIIAKILLVVVFTILIEAIISIPLSIIIGYASHTGSNILGGISLTSGIGFLIIGSMVSNLAIIASIFIVYKIFEKKDDFPLGWKSDRYLKKSFEGIIWGVVLITIPFLLVWLFRGINVANLSLSIAVLKSISLGIILFLAVAVGEEFLARGYIQGIVKKYYGAKSAIIVSSLIFSLLHIFNQNALQNPIPIISLFLAGILFGVSREITGDLWVPIGLHFSWNLFQGHIYGFEVSGLDLGSSLIQVERVGHPLLTGASFGLEGSIITMIVLMLAIYLHWWYYRGRNKPIDLELEL